MIAICKRNVASVPVGVVLTVHSSPSCSPIRAAAPAAKDVQYKVKDCDNYLKNIVSLGMRCYHSGFGVPS